MNQITLPGTDLRISRFSFGTAGLFNASGSARERGRLLAAAYDNGFTHFDTVPYYAFGIAERDLRPFLATRPEATVATKVGLYSPGGETQSAPLVFLRKAAGRAWPALSRPVVDWSVKRARTALSASLRRLGRERIDLYLVARA
jgi:D-threo-aldose 1-dehydrogenase